MSEQRNSISLIEEFKTPFEKNKIPYKNMNFKTLMYKKRIRYGRLEACGISNAELRLLPELCLEKDVNLTNMVDLPCNYKINEKNNLDSSDDNLGHQMKNRSQEFLFPTPSRREVNLKNLLDNKLKKLLELYKQ